MKHLKVKLWGQEIGRLVWESATSRIYLKYFITTVIITTVTNY